jgi:hypothetical protein
MTRHFVIESVLKGTSKKKIEGGSFTGSTPNSAAKKAFSKSCKLLKIKGRGTLDIYVRETTQGSLKKVFGYRVSRTLLEESQVRTVGEIEIVNRWKIKSRSLQ